MGLFEAIFLAHLEKRDPTRPPALDLERWELAGLVIGSPEAEVGRALGRPSSWWSMRQGKWLYPAWSLYVTCADGEVDGIEVDYTGSIGFLLGGEPEAFVRLRRPGGAGAGAEPPGLDEAKALFPDAEVTEDEDEIMFQVHKAGVGLDLAYDLEDRALARVALYADPDREAVPISEAKTGRS